MARKRPPRRTARDLVRDREKLAALSPGGSAERPIPVPTSALIEIRIRSLPCAQCGGPYKIREHRSAGGGLRDVSVVCEQCHVARVLWFRIVADGPN